MGISFSSYRTYVARLRGLASGSLEKCGPAKRAAFDGVLNGEASRELARLVPLASRRWGGSFFTDTELANRLARRLRAQPQSLVADPTVGAGDLLLAAGRLRPLKRTVEETLTEWTTSFAGVDRVSDFVAAAKLRLWLLAHVRHGVDLNQSPPRDWLPRLHDGNVFDCAEMINAADEIVLNPPFTRVRTPKWYQHGNGKVNAAAVITEFTVDHMKPSSRLHVILPEVLRTGSLYRKWRAAIANKCSISEVVSCGLFASADVDVFIATLERDRGAMVSAFATRPRTETAVSALSEKFQVSVGAVVDYRDPQVGPSYAFIHPRNLTPWRKITRIGTKRRFSGTVVLPPFVVLRRTSRPGDRWRASATMVTGKRPVAVENHLIVCRPKSHSHLDCQTLLRQLRTETVNDFLNREMRCRHLTVDVVRRIPLKAN